MALQGFKALVKAESSQIGFTAEATTTSDNQTYTITDTAKDIWAFNSTITVLDSAVPTVEDFSVNRLNGTVTFGSVDGGRVITLTGTYVTLTDVAEAKEFSFDGETDMADNTVFQDSDRGFQPTLVMATATLGKFYSIDNFFMDMLLDGTTKVIELYADSTTNPFRFYANVSDDSLEIPIEDLSEETITLQATNQMIVEV